MRKVDRKKHEHISTQETVQFLNYTFIIEVFQKNGFYGSAIFNSI